MIFTLIILVLVGAIAYFHYVQGFFSATVSAILAILSAVLALSFQEPVVRSLLQGKVGDQANALALVVLFVAIYGLLRVLFDKAIPGNLRLPVLLDKIGAGAMGLVAGCFAVGVFAVAAQMLPFRPSIGGYTRFEVVDSVEMTMPPGAGSRQMRTGSAYHILKADTIDEAVGTSLLIPVDDMVVGMTAKLSDGGALAGANSFTAVHPAYVDELFFQRLGVQAGAKRVAYNLEGNRQVELTGLYTYETLPQAEGEEPNVREGRDLPTLRSTNDKFILIARLKFSRNASDKDNLVRVSTAAVRLVANGKNYLPIGTLDLRGTPLVRANKPDDFLLVPSDGSIDFVYQVPRDELGITGDPRNRTAPMAIGQGPFIEAKRMADIDLSGQEIKRELPPALDEGQSIRRKEQLPPPKGAAPSAGNAGANAAPPSDEALFEYASVRVSPQFRTTINVGRFDRDVQVVSFDSGSATIRSGKFARLELQPKRDLREMAIGDYQVNQLWSPPGQRVVQVQGAPPSKSDSGWEWADRLGQFELLDNSGTTYRPRGAWAMVKQGPDDRLAARYNAEGNAVVTDIPRGGRPTDVWIAFLVPENSSLRELRLAGKRITSISQQVN